MCLVCFKALPRIISLHVTEHEEYGKMFQIRAMDLFLSSSFLCDEQLQRIIFYYSFCCVIHKTINYQSNTTYILTTAKCFSFYKLAIIRLYKR